MSLNPVLPSGTHTHTVQNIRNYNLTAVDPPLPTDDLDLGYNNGSIWIDTSVLPQPQAYICVSAANNAAVWVPLGGEADVPVNRTLFVDEQFGTVAGVPQDMTKPFDTLANALAASAANDVIFVQPGSYTVSAPLVLKDGVDWYFSEGATVVSSSPTAVFDDSAGAVSCVVAGFGEFTVLDGSNNVLLTTNQSSVSFSARAIESQSESTSALFDLSATSPAGAQCKYAINVESVVQALVAPIKASCTVITVGSSPSTGSFIDIQYRGQSIEGLAVINALTGSGVCDIAVQSIECGDASVDGNDIALGALFYNATDSYAIRAACQTLTSLSATQIAIAHNATATPSAPQITLSAQSISVRGGLVYAKGFSNVADIETQPRVEVTVAEIAVTDITTAPINGIYPVHCEHAWVVVRSTTYLNDRAADGLLYNFNALDIGRLLVDVRRIVLTASRAFSVSNLTPSTNVTTLVVEAGDVSAVDSLLLVNNECRATLEARQLVCTTAVVGQSAIVTQGIVAQPPPISTLLATTTITTDLLWLEAIGTDGTDLGRASMINHTAGVLNLTANTYGVGGAFYNAIRIGPALRVNTVRINLCGIIAAQSRFLFLQGGVGGAQTACLLECDTIASGLVDGGAGTSPIDVSNGRLSGQINSIIMGGDATSNGILLRDTTHFTATVNSIEVLVGDCIGLNAQNSTTSICTIGEIETISGSIIRSTSGSEMQIQFSKLKCNNATVPVEILGPGNVLLSGQQIEIQAALDAVYVSNGATLSLTVDTLSCDVADTLFHVDNSSSLLLNFQQAQGDDIRVAALHGDFCNTIRVTGELLRIASSGATARFFFLDGASDCALRCQTLNATEIASVLQATGLLRSSNVHLQIDSFYCEATQRVVYADSNSQVYVSFQLMNVNALSNDAFTAFGNGTRLQIAGSNLSCFGKFNPPNIFALPSGTSVIVANVDNINLGGNETASLVACAGGQMSLVAQRLNASDVVRIVNISDGLSDVNVSIDGLFVDNATTETLILVDAGTLRIAGKQWTIGNPVLQTLFHSRNSATLDVDLTVLQASNPCGHVLHSEIGSTARLLIDVFDIDGSETGAFLLSEQFDTLIRTERLQVGTNTTGSPFLSASGGTLTLQATRIVVNEVDSLLTLTDVDNAVIEWGECYATLRNSGINITDSKCTFFGQRTEMPADPASLPTAAFIVGSGTQVYGVFGYFSCGMIGFNTQGGADMNVSFEQLRAANSCLVYESTGTVTFLPKQAISFAGPVIYIKTSFGVAPVTLGGYLNAAAAAHAIEYDPAAVTPPSIRLFSAMLISSAESIYSPTAAVSVGAMPSSARFDVNANVTVEPTGAIMVGAVF